MKIKIKVEVPDKGCEGCCYFSHTYREPCYGVYEEIYRCELFNCIIDNNKKCIGCTTCSVEEDEE